MLCAFTVPESTNTNFSHMHSCARHIVCRLEALEEHTLSPGEIDAHEACTICLAEFVQTDKVLKLECDHMYHSECLLPWLSRQRSCPLCRHRIGAGPGGQGSRGEADEESIRIARMLAHFIPRIASTAGFMAPPPRRGYPKSTINVTSNPYAHYQGGRDTTVGGGGTAAAASAARSCAGADTHGHANHELGDGVGHVSHPPVHEAKPPSEANAGGGTTANAREVAAAAAERRRQAQAAKSAGLD